MELKRVVVTGLGAITPLGHSAPETWKNMLAGMSGAGPITLFDASKFKTRIACEVKNFDASLYLEKKEARKLDRFTQFALVAAAEAMKDSGIDLEKINRRKAGVLWGSGIGGIQQITDELRDFYKGDGTPRFNPFFVPKMILDIAAGHISIKYGLNGPNYAVCSACATSTNTIIDAFNLIRLNKSDFIVTGGSEAPITIPGIGGFSSAKAMSERNDDPFTASRPFDADRDGFVCGEGAGALILEELEHAKARGAKIYAEVAGGGMSGDAYHITAPHPEGLGAQYVMENVLEDAGITIDKIDYINVHGTSTPMGDGIELKAISRVFGEKIYDINISSTKSMTGHLLGAAGAVESLACLMAIQEGIIPPTINQFNRDPEIDAKLNLTPNTPQKREVTYALNNTFGFGGHNASVIFKNIASRFCELLPDRLLQGFFSLNRNFSSKVYQLTGAYPMNAQLYHLAFMHSSVSAETNLSNERLEFLGDAVLGVVIADYLFQKFPFRDEGYLTDLRSKMVSRNNMNSIAYKMGIEEMLQYNKNDSYLNKKSISGNALEALIGAVYLDHGFAGAKKFIMNKIVAQHIDIEDLETTEFNYKSKILEWAQKNEVKIEFTVLEELRDKRHSFYRVALMVNGNETGIGADNSKKIAEKKAAKEGYAKLGIKSE